MRHQEILDLAADNSLDVDLVRATLAPAALLVMGDDSHSQLTGDPLLPPGTPWPRWDPTRFYDAEIQDARQYIVEIPSRATWWTQRIEEYRELQAQGPVALSFVMQVDLAALQRVHKVDHLPDHGLLSFFMELERGAGCTGRADPEPPWQVHWFPDVTQLQRTPAPEQLEARLPAVGLKVVQGWTLPDRIVVDGQVVLDQWEDHGFEELLEALERRGVIGGNQVGGHLAQVQGGDVLHAAVLQDAGFDLWNRAPGDLDPPVAHRARDWGHLLQLGTDYGRGDWVGVSNFWRPDGPWTPGRQARITQVFEQT